MGDTEIIFQNSKKNTSFGIMKKNGKLKFIGNYINYNLEHGRGLLIIGNHKLEFYADFSKKHYDYPKVHNNKGNLVYDGKDIQSYIKNPDVWLAQGIEIFDGEFYRGKFVGKANVLTSEYVYQGFLRDGRFEGKGILRNLKTKIEKKGKFHKGNLLRENNLIDFKVYYLPPIRSKYLQSLRKNILAGGLKDDEESVEHRETVIYTGGIKNNKKHGKGLYFHKGQQFLGT